MHIPSKWKWSDTPRYLCGMRGREKICNPNIVMEPTESDGKTFIIYFSFHIKFGITEEM